MSLLWLILLIIGGPIKSLCIVPPKSTQLYVVPFPSLIGDDGDGSLEHPYSSLQKALDHIKHNYYHDLTSTHRTTINLYPTYHFVNTIHISQVHSHTRLTTMNGNDIAFYKELAASEHTHRRLATAVISGGIPVTDWIAIGNNTYKAVITRPIFVNQLYINNKRIARSRVPTNFSEYLQYAASFNDSIQAHYGFQYVPGQFNYPSLVDAMVVIYHSWSTSHHYIDRLIPENNTVLFSNPSDYSIGHFVYQGQRRFHIENLCEALIQNSFCFVNETKTIYLMTDGSYDPTKVEIITPVYEFILSIVGDTVTNPVEDIIIDNIAIQHSAWNINRTQLADGLWQAFLTTDSLYIANATSITISDVEISRTGSYAICIKEGTSNIHIINSFINDTGAGGIRIGQTNKPILYPTNSINIISNEISYGGNVFAGGVALATFRADNVALVDNLIHHHRYTGISVGREFGYAQSFTTNVLIQANYIYNTGQHILCDQGGIYTLGVQPGTIITGNVVKNVYSYAVFMWGIYLDEGSSEIIVSNNVVYNTGWASIFQHYGANNTIINNVFARASLIPLPSPESGVPNPDGDIHIERAENHTSWIFTNNIVYDTYQGSNHSIYSSNPNVTTLFNKNIYYNPYGTQLLFGTDNTSFAKWQSTGQDNDSVIADPLFIGDVNQCDFFTIQSNSPAAKLGFANITKLSKWTPGCVSDDQMEYQQFYHW
jgi:parallel beta-helix repeat protein